MEKEKIKNNGTGTAVARKAYETKVGIEAFNRVGRNPQIKGVVHEVLYKDALNADPKNIINGSKAVLTKATNAVRDDVLLMNGGKVIGRYQLKDTANSIAKTVKQAASPHYNGTNLMGTVETTAKFGKTVAKQGGAVTQKMTSTGISSADTSRIAVETIGGKVATGSLAKVASSSGIAGAAISGGIEVISSGKKYIDGEIDGEEFVGKVAKETVGGGVSAAGASAAATAVTAGVASALAATAAPIWVPAAAGIGAAVAVGSAIKGVWDFFWD